MSPGGLYQTLGSFCLLAQKITNLQSKNMIVPGKT